MWKLLVAILSLAAAVAEAKDSAQCTKEFVAQYGSMFAIPGSCEKFLACRAGKLEELSCPRGMLFDVELSRCIGEHQAECLPENWSAPDGLCKPDELSVHPDPHSCARFVICLGEKALPGQCSPGLLFNSANRRCADPRNVVCNISCPSEDDEQVYLPDSTGQDCARYYICKDGIPHPAECPSMMYFDLLAKICVLPENASCRIEGVGCSDHDEYVDNPKSCSSYYECEGGFPHLRECGVGLDDFFNELCDIESEDCERLTETTTEIDQSTMTEPFTTTSVGWSSTDTSIVTVTEQPTTETSVATVTQSTSVPTTESSTVTDSTISTEEASTATPTEQPSTTESISPSSTIESTTAIQTEQPTTEASVATQSTTVSSSPSVSTTESSTVTDSTIIPTSTEVPPTVTPTEQLSTTESTNPSSSTESITAPQTEQPTSEASVATQSTTESSTPSVSTTESSTVTDSTIIPTSTEVLSTATPTEQPSTTESTNPSSSTESITAPQTEQPTTETSVATVTSNPTTESTTVTDIPPTTESTISTDSTTVSTSTEAQSTSSASTSTSTTAAITTSTSSIPTTTSMEPSSTTTLHPPVDPAEMCRGVDIGVVPHPYNCYQYFVCIFGSGREASCSSGMIFESQSLLCVPGDRVTCTATVRALEKVRN